jgi:hypothetical protein
MAADDSSVSRLHNQVADARGAASTRRSPRTARSSDRVGCPALLRSESRPAWDRRPDDCSLASKPRLPIRKRPFPHPMSTTSGAVRPNKVTRSIGPGNIFLRAVLVHNDGSRISPQSARRTHARFAVSCVPASSAALEPVHTNDPQGIRYQKECHAGERADISIYGAANTSWWIIFHR